MSSNPVGKNRKAMWQSMVLTTLNRLHPDLFKAESFTPLMLRVAQAADMMLDEMDKRFAPERQTITLKK